MEELNSDVIEQIKHFEYFGLTDEQKSLIDKLILNDELKSRYKEYGLCKECKQPKTHYNWCRSCNAKHFQQGFKTWSSGNDELNGLIQKTQLVATGYKNVIEWIEYDRFEGIDYLTKGGFGITYKATWKDGYIWGWDSKLQKWKRNKHDTSVALISSHKSQNITDELLKEVSYFLFFFIN